MAAKRALRMLMALALAGLLAGCGKPRLDASSPAAWSDSVAEVRGSVSGATQRQFDVALADLAPGGLSPELDGLRADDVIALAQQRRGAGAAATREQRERRIAELSAREALAKAGAARVAAFRVSAPRFYREAGPDGTARPFVRFMMDNGAAFTVDRLALSAQLTGAGRDTPWLDQVFEFDVFGGLAPGQGREALLPPGPGTDWARTDAPDGVTLRLTVLAAREKNGNWVYSAASFPPADQRELRELRAVAD